MSKHDTRPSKAQFVAMSSLQRREVVKPLAPAVEIDGEPKQLPFTTMTGAELRRAREAAGKTPEQLAKDLKLKGHRPALKVLRWEEGNVKKFGHKAIVPGRVAAHVLALGQKDESTQGAE